MIHIFKYLDKKTKYLTIIGALANGGLALGQPLVVAKALSIDQNNLTYSSIWKFALFGFSVYFALYSLMLFCNHANNVFRREIHMNIRTALFQKLMEDREYSEDEKITMLTQDMEFLGDNFFERYMSISCWGFGALITAIYIIAQNVLLGSIFVFFTILRPIPQFLMNNKLKNSGDEMSQGRTAVHNQISDSIRGAQTLRMNQALPENSQRVWNINLVINEPFKSLLLPIILFSFVMVSWSFLAKYSPWYWGSSLLCRVIMFQWLAWLLCILLLVNW